MNIILLDLEWDSAYSTQEGRFVNEIIEFGAVKLDENLQEVSAFRQVVRSRLTKKLSGRFKRLTGISNEEMLAGIGFGKALQMYTDWVEDRDVTMTWSNTDLYVLLENCRLFTKHRRIPCIRQYVDVQKYAQWCLRQGGFDDHGNQMALEHAAAVFGIDTASMDLHRAETDSRLTELILQKCFDEKRLQPFLEDTTAPDYYDRLTFKAYIIPDLDSPYVDRQQMYFECDRCGQLAKRVTPWVFKNRWFKAQFHCRRCNRDFIGKIAFKKLYDSVSVKKRVDEMPAPKSSESEQDGAAAPQQA